MTLSEQIRVLCVRCKVSEVELARRLDRIVLSLFDFDIVGVLKDGVIYIVKQYLYMMESFLRSNARLGSI